jgi:hypothetical protein
MVGLITSHTCRQARPAGVCCDLCVSCLVSFMVCACVCVCVCVCVFVGVVRCVWVWCDGGLDWLPPTTVKRVDGDWGRGGVVYVLGVGYEGMHLNKQKQQDPSNGLSA